jgi:hypothetical protein
MFHVLVVGCTRHHQARAFRPLKKLPPCLLLSKFHARRTNRLRAGQNAAVLLLDLVAVDIR